MSGLGIDTTQLTQTVLSLGTAQATSSVQSGTPEVDTDGDQGGSVGQAASVHISRQAQLLSKLQQLQQQDPAKFKQVVTDIADKLNQAAQNSNGKAQEFLSKLAAKFQQAANGDLSGFQPTQSAPSNAAQAAYAQSTQPPDALQSALQQAQGGTQGGGHHHHHHSGSGGATQQALSSVFQELDSALSGSTGSPTASDPTEQTSAAAA